MEYPVGIQNYANTDAGGHEIINDFNYGLEHEAESDVWADYSVPDAPFTIFMNSYYHTGDLLADHGESHGGHILRRMIFAHQVTAMEAYLGDTLINAVMTDSKAMQRLIERDSELVKEKFSLVEISKEPTLVKRKVQEYLRSIQYHNLAKVDKLYGIVFDIRVLNETDYKASLFKAVLLRHDCVHRNGFDKDGNELLVFTKQYVQGTADLIKHFVERIESAINTRYGETVWKSFSCLGLLGLYLIRYCPATSDDFAAVDVFAPMARPFV